MTKDGNLIIWKDGLKQSGAAMLPELNQLKSGQMYQFEPAPSSVSQKFKNVDGATGFYIFKQ